MKRLLTFFLTLLIFFSVGIPIYAAEFGDHPERASKRLVVTPGKKLNIRSLPTTKGTLIYQLRPGDIVYVDSIQFIYRDGYEWLPVTAKWGRGLSREAYVTNFNRFLVEDNPLYDPPTEEQRKIEDAVESSQIVAKWLLLILSIVFAAIFVIRYFSEDFKEKIVGYPNNGMRRAFFFNPQPYASIIFFTLFLLGGIALAVATMLLVGGVVFGILWLIKILCYILVWVGVIGCLVCVVLAFTSSSKAILGIIIGGLIWYFGDSIRSFGSACADTGLKFFNEFNILGYTVDLTLQYWRPVLIITTIPLGIFLMLAVLWLLFAGALILFEKIMTRSYSIKHPCPHCHQPSEPARYLSKDEDGYWQIPNNIQLRPGLYGLFHIKHPYTHEKMPTMLINGRDKLARECANCGKRIQADEGTERHLVMVGSPQSGKSVVTYRLMAEIFNRAGRDKVEFTDQNNTIRDKGMLRKVESIMEKGKVADEDLPAKTAVRDTASTQLIIRRNHLPVPYRLFINDVGGELFNIESSAQRQDRTRFFHNADTILFLIDPVTTDFSDCDLSDDFKAWIDKNSSLKIGKLKVRDLQDTVDNLLSLHGNSARNIHLNIVFPKVDLHYFPTWVNYNSQETLQRFINEELGLGDLLHWGSQFADITIHAVSATSRNEKSNISSLINKVIVEQLGIRI